MKEFTHFQQKWTLIQSQDSAINTLAIDSALIRYLPAYHDNLSDPNSHMLILHWYPISQPTVLLGAKDTRLKNYQVGRAFLENQGYKVLVRPHGGLAIVCDPGILNLSLIQDGRMKALDIQSAYLDFIQFIRFVFQDFPIDIDFYEMATSYCPGKFDLIVNQTKIGGLAQRRFKHGISTAAYLSISGNQKKRGQIMKEFYQISQADSSYPHIDPKSMANLSDHLDTKISTQELLGVIKDKLNIHEHEQTIDIHDSRLLKEIQEARQAIYLRSLY